MKRLAEIVVGRLLINLFIVSVLVCLYIGTHAMPVGVPALGGSWI